MKTKIVLLFICVFGLSGCVTGALMEQNHSEEKWFVIGYGGVFTPDMFYCLANKDSNGNPKPVCYEAKYMNLAR